MKAERKIIMKVDDEESIEKLCNSTWEAVYRFVYYKVQSEEEAEDITQETYIKAISYIRKTRAEIDNTIGFLNKTEGNIRTLQFRALQNLSELLRNDYK